MSIIGALNQVAALRIEGVAAERHYTWRRLPGLLTQDKLPAVIWSWNDSQQEALRSIGFSGPLAKVEIALRGRLLIDFIGPAQANPARLAAIEMWLERLVMMLQGAGYRLGGTLVRDMSIQRFDIGTTDWQGELFVGLDWILQLPVKMSGDGA